LKISPAHLFVPGRQLCQIYTVGQIFSQNSSTQNYDSEFQKFKKQKEKSKLNFKSKNLEEYNRPFSLDELRKSLDKAHDTACGPDDIHYQLLKHLPDKTVYFNTE
jgi:potassium voltage-gated channel Eag-related subfamily H protein 8